jgi:sugar (pentulose or hexulose) kinase
MILAIDLGSTSFKVGLFDRRLRLRAENHAPLRYRFGAGGRVELDVAVAEAALRRILPRRQPIAVLAITSQAQTFTVVDRAGRATRPFVSWQDNRAVAADAWLRRRLPEFGAHSSFADLLPGLQICQIKHRPLKHGETALLLPSYFVQRFTGNTVTDDNLAAMSGLYSLAESGWWPAALRACSLRASQLPPVVLIGTVAGVTIRNDFHLPVGIPVVLAGNDQTAGAYGARLDENSATLVTLGTAQVVYRCVNRLPAPARDVIRGPYPGGRHYRMAADLWGGNLINWTETVLAGCATDDEFFTQAGRAPAGCHGLEFDPERGEWRGCGFQHTAAEMARSILEALSMRLAGLVHELGSSRRGTFLVAGGGATRPLWRNIAASRLHCRLRPIVASPLTGAARMAINFLCSKQSKSSGQLFQHEYESLR